MILIMTAQVHFFNDFSDKDPHLNPVEYSLHKIGARFYKNTLESLHLHLHILRLLFLTT